MVYGVQYGDSGWFTCAGYPGSFQHETQDAQTLFVEWGFDYLKYGNCASTSLPPLSLPFVDGRVS